MAIMKNLFAASVLASLASAVPMPGAHRRNVTTHTVTHTAWTTLDVTTTVYVNDAIATPQPEKAAITTSVAPVVPSVDAGNFAAVPTATPASVAVVAPVAPVAPTPAPASSVAPTSAPAAPVSTVDVQPKANAGGPCEGQGSGCSGDITYYNGAGGYGACGSIIDDNQPIVALPHGLMGTQSNGNPYCGRTVSIKGTDGSIHTGTVADKCMGCEAESIDLTPVLFQAVAPAGDGRVKGIEWWFS